MEWNIRDAYIIDPEGNKIADFMGSKLHVLEYSVPIDAGVGFEELNEHLYSISKQPDAIPYRTSHYSQRWGFCIRHETRHRLKRGTYRVYIDSTLENGALTYGEFFLPGETDREVLLSTNICHPSLANNELSGQKYGDECVFSEMEQNDTACDFYKWSNYHYYDHFSEL